MGDGPQEDRYMLNEISSVDQTPFLFCFVYDATYDVANAAKVWIHAGASGLENSVG